MGKWETPSVHIERDGSQMSFIIQAALSKLAYPCLILFSPYPRT